MGGRGPGSLSLAVSFIRSEFRILLHFLLLHIHQLPQRNYYLILSSLSSQTALAARVASYLLWFVKQSREMGWLFSELGFAFPCWSAEVEEELREFTLDLLTQRFNIYLGKKGGKEEERGCGFWAAQEIEQKRIKIDAVL